MKKYFGTDGIRGRVGELPISADWILKLGWAAGRVLGSISKSQKTKVVIGKDTRVSGYLLESALQAGLSSAGIDILLLGPIPTPAIAFLTRDLNADAGIVISASHNPYDDNGIKFFDSKGYKLSDKIESFIEAQLEQDFSTVDPSLLGKALRIRDTDERYIKFCVNTFPKELNLKTMKLIVDCAHGSTYRVAPLIFKLLGAEVIEMNTKPNGFNINDHCGSTYPSPLAEQVLAHKADLGIAFDGDGDRVLIIDQNGEILDGDELLYIITKWYASTNRLKGGVVGTVMSNYGLEEAIERLGLPFIRSAVGDHAVLEMALEKGWNLGGESSGHIICLDCNSTGDGIVSALQVLAASLSLQQSLSELKKEIMKYPQTLINVPVLEITKGSPLLNRDNILEHNGVQSAIVETENLLRGCGRLLVRPSGTEPLIRILVEGQDGALVQNIAEKLANQLKKI